MSSSGCVSGELTPPEPTASAAPRPTDGDRRFKEAKERAVERFTRDYLLPLHGACAGNVSEMARRAGLARNYVQQLLDRYGLRQGVIAPDDGSGRPPRR